MNQNLNTAILKTHSCQTRLFLKTVDYQIASSSVFDFDTLIKTNSAQARSKPRNKWSKRGAWPRPKTLITTMLEQTSAVTQFQSISTKYRILVAQLTQLQSLSPDPAVFDELEQDSLRTVAPQAKVALQAAGAV